MVGGLAFAIGQFACSNYISVELTDIVASLLVGRRDRRASCASGSPSEPLLGERGAARRPAIAGAAVADAAARGRGAPHARATGTRLARRRSSRAYAPYLIIIVVFALAQWGPIKDFLDERDARRSHWPGPGHPQRQGRGADAR